MLKEKYKFIIFCSILVGTLSGCLSPSSGPNPEVELLPVEEWTWGAQYPDVERIDRAFKTDKTLQFFECPDDIGFDEVPRAHQFGAIRWIWFLDLGWCGRDMGRATPWMEEARSNDTDEDVFVREADRTLDLLQGLATNLSQLSNSSFSEFEMAGYLMSIWVEESDRVDSLVRQWSEGSTASEGVGTSEEGRAFQNLARHQVGAERLVYLVKTLEKMAGYAASCGPVPGVRTDHELQIGRDRLNELVTAGIEKAPWLGGSWLGLQDSIRNLEESQERGWDALAFRAVQESRFHYLTAKAMMEHEDWMDIPKLNFTSDMRSQGIVGLNQAVSSHASQWVREQVDFNAAVLLNEATSYEGEVLAHSEVLKDVAETYKVNCL